VEKFGMLIVLLYPPLPFLTSLETFACSGLKILLNEKAENAKDCC
jgi:hypothetical protein